MRLVALVQHMFLHNGWIKLVCVAVAALLWVILNSSQGGTVEAQPIGTQSTSGMLGDSQSVADTFHPSTTVTQEKQLTQRIAISPSATGRLPAGYELTRVTVTPAFTEVSAPESFFSQLQPIFTESILLDQIEETSDVTVALVLPEGVQLVDATLVSVVATVTVTDAP